MTGRPEDPDPSEQVFLSVVVPAHNVEKHIGVTLRSLLSHGRGLEVVVVDDGSTDGSLSRIERMAAGATDITFRVISQANSGASVARNVGLGQARGKYVLFLDGDDYVGKALVGQLSLATEREPDVVCWAWEVVSEQGRPTGQRGVGHPRLDTTLTGLAALEAVVCSATLSVWTASMAFRTDFLRQNGLEFSRGCQYGEDREFQYKALAAAQTVRVIPSVLSSYVVRGGSLSTTVSVRILDSFAARRRASQFVASLHPMNGGAIAERILLSAATNYVRDVRRYVDASEDLTRREALRQMAFAYPDLDDEARAVLRRAALRRQRLPWSMVVYGIHPWSYWTLVSVRNWAAGELRRSSY